MHSTENLGMIGDMFKAAYKVGGMKGNWLMAANEAVQRGLTVEEIQEELTAATNSRFTPQAVAKQFAEEFIETRNKITGGMNRIAADVYKRLAEKPKATDKEQCYRGADLERN